jgi:hypothetical protein
MKTAAQILRDAKALIEDPKHWIKGDFVVYAGTPYVKYCAHAALQEAGEINTPENAKAWQIIWSLLPSYGWWSGTPPKHTFVTYNDDYTTTHADVMRIFSEAIAVAEGK